MCLFRKIHSGFGNDRKFFSMIVPSKAGKVGHESKETNPKSQTIIKKEIKNMKSFFNSIGSFLGGTRDGGIFDRHDTYAGRVEGGSIFDANDVYIGHVDDSGHFYDRDEVFGGYSDTDASGSYDSYYDSQDTYLGWSEDD